jgi:F420-dependent methylenetetrahydromethanopterin dehydrogenase
VADVTFKTYDLPQQHAATVMIAAGGHRMMTLAAAEADTDHNALNMSSMRHQCLAC